MSWLSEVMETQKFILSSGAGRPLMKVCVGPPLSLVGPHLSLLQGMACWLTLPTLADATTALAAACFLYLRASSAWVLEGHTRFYYTIHDKLCSQTVCLLPLERTVVLLAFRIIRTLSYF